MSDTDTDTDILTACASLLRRTATATRKEITENPYWESALHPQSRWYANGVQNAIGGPAGVLAGMLSPDAADALADAMQNAATHPHQHPDLIAAARLMLDPAAPLPSGDTGVPQTIEGAVGVLGRAADLITHLERLVQEITQNIVQFHDLDQLHVIPGDKADSVGGVVGAYLMYATQAVDALTNTKNALEAGRDQLALLQSAPSADPKDT